MAKFRVETVFEPTAGKFYSELYFPDDAETPIACTKPIYDSHEHAMAHAVELMQTAFPDKPMKGVRVK